MKQEGISYNEIVLLNRIGREFSAHLDLDSVIDAIMSRVKDVLECGASSVILYDKIKDSLVFYAASGAGAGEIKGLQIPLGKGIAGWVFENRTPARVKNVRNDERFYPGIDRISGITTKSLICVPLERENRIIGVLEGINKVSGSFTQKDLQMLTAISQLAGISIQNSIIHKNLERKNDELKQLNRELEEFVHIVSHELQTPLASIEGYIGLLQAEIREKGGDISWYIDRIESNTDHLLHFIKRLLGFIRLKNRSITVDTFNPVGVLREVCVQLEREIMRKKARIRYPEDFPAVRCDRYLFHHIMLNLIQNSLKYAADDIEPDISVGFERVGDDDERGEVRFYVRDNGPGLPEENHDKVFTIYQRSGTALPEGYGIGLAFVKKAVNLLGGSVWVKSGEEGGTTFFFSLPGWRAQA